jgi:hypothetical protein
MIHTQYESVILQDEPMTDTAKFTVSMTAAEFKELESARRAQGLSRSQFIRDSLRAVQAGSPNAGKVGEDAAAYETRDLPDLVSAEDRRKRAIAAAGRFRSGVTDLSTHHDEYLAEAFAAVSPESEDGRNRRRS